jgi:hypothetical protein
MFKKSFTIWLKFLQKMLIKKMGFFVGGSCIESNRSVQIQLDQYISLIANPIKNSFHFTFQ